MFLGVLTPTNIFVLLLLFALQLILSIYFIYKNEKGTSYVLWLIMAFILPFITTLLAYGKYRSKKQLTAVKA